MKHIICLLMTMLFLTACGDVNPRENLPDWVREDGRYLSLKKSESLWIGEVERQYKREIARVSDLYLPQNRDRIAREALDRVWRDALRKKVPYISRDELTNMAQLNLANEQDRIDTDPYWCVPEGLNYPFASDTNAAAFETRIDGRYLDFYDVLDVSSDQKLEIGDEREARVAEMEIRKKYVDFYNSTRDAAMQAELDDDQAEARWKSHCRSGLVLWQGMLELTDVQDGALTRALLFYRN